MATKTESKTPDEIEDDVLAMIPTLTADELEAVCGVIPLVVPADKQGNRREIRKLLTNELMKDSEDDNNATLMVIHDHLFPPQTTPQTTPSTTVSTTASTTPSTTVTGTGSAAAATASPAVKSEDESQKKVESCVSVDSYVETRMRECKISGTIGGKTAAKNMTFTRLQFEVNNARKSKCPPNVIIAGIIKAIDPSNDARTYLETSPDLTLEEVLDFIKNHCAEIDESGTLVTQFQNACQKPEQDANNFVTGLMVLRKKVMQLSIEKGLPYPENLLRNEFFHIMFTGLRSESLRTELREMVKGNWSLTDNQLLSLVRKASANKAERDLKLGENVDEKEDVVEVSALSTSHSGKEKKKKDNPFARIEELLVKQDKEMKELRTEIMELKSGNTSSTSGFPNVNAPSFSQSPQPPQLSQQQQKQINSLQNQLEQLQGFARLRPKRRNECNNCWQTNADRCNHCLGCGSTAHKVANCDKKN